MSRKQLFNYQKEIVRIVEVKPKEMKEYFELGKSMPLFYFEKKMRQFLKEKGSEQEFNIILSHNRVITELTSEEIDRDYWLKDRRNPLEKKFLQFRSSNRVGTKNACRW